ncbi:DUF805 domain-containing protein [Kitasatospora sp. MAP5-34]|uniref:DUF805 domain-containing protein n=1 Tax=Kitasatospora sp. MAP5-34 TaxID=3035102 RepID=UPI002475FC60|nr:DUF805 domain-containing protein [Kitasatospora sp. MAP5-34]MDH6578014.1 uncharacterized membrane protein YhaH (DUF805 family) [Kitasatospora sp. MAP5-34]
MDWYLAVLKNYVGFSGRARRQEYWMFTLFSVLASVILTIVDNVAGTGGLLAGIYSLAVLLPALAVLVRRLHDTGRSAWWLLIGLTCVGFVVLIIFSVLEGDQSDNKYGPNPKLNPAQA